MSSITNGRHYNKDLDGYIQVHITSDDTQATSESNITGLRGQLPTTLGQKTSANSLAVVLPSDQTVSISGSVTASGTVAVSNFPVTQPVSAVALPLPSGASTSALQTTGNNSLSSIDGKIVAVNTGAVVVSSSALPTGASTSALQTTGNTSLSSIDGKIVTVNTGAVTVSASALPTGAATSANQTTANASLSSIDTKTPALVSGRQPVDGSGVTQPVSGTITSNIGTTGGLALDSNLTGLRAQIPTTLGQKTSANSLSTVIASDQIVKMQFGDSSSIDAFGRIRTAEPETLFDSKQIVDNQPLFWDDQQTSGAGTTSTYLTNQAASRLAVTNATAGTRVRQTFERFNYQPGKSMIITLTGVLGAAATGITKRLGYFDAQNGVFFQLSGTTLSVVIRSFVTGSAVDSLVAQASWNLDRLDGGGSSGVTIDLTKAQIFIIDFQWLGVGRVRFGVNIGGQTIYVHQVLNANVLSTVWMSNPNLPVRYEISNSGAGPASQLDQMCASVITEGGREDLGFVLSVDRGDTVLTTLNNNSIYPLIAMRLKSTHLMATVTELYISILSLSATAFRYCLLLNPTVTGTAFSFTGVTNAAVEVQTNTTSATTVSGGTQLLSGYVDASTTQGVFVQDVPTDLRLGSSITGVSDIIVLGVQRLSGTTESFYAGMSFREAV